jgi:hypothetical protein
MRKEEHFQNEKHLTEFLQKTLHIRDDLDLDDESEDCISNNISTLTYPDIDSHQIN